MKAYNFEIYTSNPETGEEGWDIKLVSVFAEDGQEARLSLKWNVPNFESIILFNRSTELSENETAIYATGAKYFYTDGNYNPIAQSLAPSAPVQLVNLGVYHMTREYCNDAKYLGLFQLQSDPNEENLFFRGSPANLTIHRSKLYLFSFKMI